MVEVDRTKIIHYVHKPKWDMLYGRSDLRAAYRSWYIKDQLVKLWPMFLEKFGGGIAVASRMTSDAPASNSSDYATLQSALANMSSLRSVILPQGVEMDIHFPASTDQFEKACVFFDLAMAKALLVPNLLGLSHTGQTGAFSQSQTQFEAFFWTLNSDACALEETIEEDLIRDVGDQNWGDGEYPCFAFNLNSFDQVVKLLTSWKDMLGVKAALPSEDDERFIRTLLGMPQRDPDAEPLVDPMAEKQLALDQQIAQQGAQAANESKVADQALAAVASAIDALAVKVQASMEREPAPPPAGPSITVNNQLPADPSQDTRLNPPDPGAGSDFSVHFHEALVNCTPYQVEKASRRVAFAVILQRTDNSQRAAVTELATQVAKATQRSLGNEDHMRQLLDDDPADVQTIAFDRGDVARLKSISREIVQRAYQVGQDHARNELARASSGTELAAEVRKISAKALDQKAVAYFDTNAFRMAGDTSDQARKLIQQELQNGIKYGRPLAEVRTNIWDRLVAKGLSTRDAVRGVETDDAVNQALDELWVDSEEEATAYLNTLVRTNTFEALNEARFTEFTDPALGDFVQAFQYAAVMDSSTTEICEYMNDRIYSADSDVWDGWRPPLHFNCRSVLVPITTIDGWDGEESDPPTVVPQEGFG